MPVRVSKQEHIFCMKKNVLGIGAGWPLHVQMYPDKQVKSSYVGIIDFRWFRVGVTARNAGNCRPPPKEALGILCQVNRC